VTPEERAVIEAAIALIHGASVFHLVAAVEALEATFKMWNPTICPSCGETHDSRKIVAHLKERHGYPR
jgi:hypothetical protein